MSRFARPLARLARLRLVRFNLARPALALIALAAGLSFAGRSMAQDGPDRPVAFEAQLSADAQSARITFTMSAAVAVRATVLQSPDRIVLDLPEVNFQLPADAGRKAQGLVKSYRYGMFAPGRSRVVIDLGGPALPSKTASEPILNGAAHTLVIDLKKADRESFAKAARTRDAQDSADTPALRRVPDGDSRPVVVIDPGHGGIDSGAIGVNNALEKDVVFAFARELKAKLEQSGLIRVILTRDADNFVSLPDRVRVAQDHGASLFVSVHADTLAVSPEVRGLTVYTSAERASDAESARLAEAENKVDALAGVDTNDSTEEVAGILSDLTRRETRTYSHLFARTLVGQMTASSKLNKNPTRSAGFRVLKAPDVPSVLIELGYLSSKTDVENLTTPAWRERAADGVASSITAFLAPRLARGGDTAAQ
jgi:N-acetylmuramoyl-L-alanine amidase